MKILITDYEDYSEVTIRDASGVNLFVYTFDDKKQARSFVSGWNCANQVANNLIQSMPMSAEIKKG